MKKQIEMQIKYLQNCLNNNYHDNGFSRRKIEDAIELLSNILDALTLV